MSHELRTPLNAILGFAQMIESGEPTPTPIQKRSLDQILQAGWYLLELINEILDLALIESGKLSLSIEPVSLADVMRECATMIEPQALKRGINVTFPVLDQSYCVKADRIRVKQVLINLLSNAIKYNRENGTVIVICFEDSPGLMRICVQDTGEGLSPEKIAQLFQPFNRLGQEVNAEEGTGIGLVMTKRLVELMGGNIGLESHEGKGSTFWIELNLTTYTHLALDNNADTQKQLLPTLKKTMNADEPMYTLLYVEDNPANLMLIEDLMLRRDDINLLTARDGLSGIAIARAAQPDLILMDINLPGISGIDALIILSADKITAHIPVVALSANAIPSDIEKGLKAGFFRYLTKPIKVDEFMHTLDEALVFTVSQKKVFYRYKEKANDLVG
jgi:CheY-like chemotaxis protein/two-component sensor histidine kinase